MNKKILVGASALAVALVFGAVGGAKADPLPEFADGVEFDECEALAEELVMAVLAVELNIVAKGQGRDRLQQTREGLVSKLDGAIDKWKKGADASAVQKVVDFENKIGQLVSNPKPEKRKMHEDDGDLLLFGNDLLAEPAGSIFDDDTDVDCPGVPGDPVDDMCRSDHGADALKFCVDMVPAPTP